ncbi:MAG: short-chain dehydrogenase [Nitrospinaceae bacterium]|nr:MAG: short-chain dehydrogenase [Nitrospinaceae bacterium]
MKIEDSITLVTGANRGIGRALVTALATAGAQKIYAGMRDVETFKRNHPDIFDSFQGKVEPLALDITKKNQVDFAVEKAYDVNLLINNAGIANYSGLIAADDLSSARQEMEVNYFATLSMIRGFAPVLKKNGGGAIVNILSVASLVNFPLLGSYSASKAALYSLTQGVRAELAAQGTAVTGVYPGPIDTDMARGIDMKKASPDKIALGTLDAIEKGEEDAFIDQMAVEIRQGLLSDPKSVERQCGEMLPA